MNLLLINVTDIGVEFLLFNIFIFEVRVYHSFPDSIFALLVWYSCMVTVLLMAGHLSLSAVAEIWCELPIGDLALVSHLGQCSELLKEHKLLQSAKFCSVLVLYKTSKPYGQVYHISQSRMEYSHKSALQSVTPEQSETSNIGNLP